MAMIMMMAMVTMNMAITILIMVMMAKLIMRSSSDIPPGQLCLRAEWSWKQLG